jgi:peptidoglycan/LPS O-acetylase OafA/YrhL
MSNKKTFKLDQLTFTRFLAAIAIVFYHDGKDTFLFKWPLTSFVFEQANVGVSYFFILSGFVLIIAYANKTIYPREFYIKRIARIYPLYFLALLSIATLKLFFYKSGCNPVEFFLSMLGLQSWIPPYPLVLNIPGWSISVEFLFYALFPILVRFIYKRRSLKQSIQIAVVFWFISQAILFISYNFFFEGVDTTSFFMIYYHPLSHLNQFIIGNIAGLFFLKYKTRVSIKYPAAWLLICIAALYILLKFPLPVVYNNGFLAIIFIPFILVLSFDTGVFSKILSHKILVFLGEISYGIYIIQQPVHLYLSNLFNMAGIKYSFYIHLIIVVCLAALCYVFIEKPARNYINNWWKRKNQNEKSTVPETLLVPIKDRHIQAK